MPSPFRTLGESLFDIATRALSRLSLRNNQRLGQTIGWLAWVTHSRLRQVAEINLELCFPTMSPAERRLVARRSLLHTGMALTEAPWIGLRPSQQTLDMVKNVEGESLVAQSLDASRGLIVATPHLGSWELTCLMVSEKTPLTYLYRSPRNRLLEPHLLKWRSNLGGMPARLDSSGIRHVLKQLQQGAVIGILPDQEPDPGAGTFAPFFGVSAYTMTLLCKLASRRGSTVLFCVAERLPKGRGWKIHYVSADKGIRSKDEFEAAAALNLSVQRCIEFCTEQYMWSYKRFRLMENGERRPYRQ